MPCICYYVLKGSSLLICDERNKKHLIDLILESMEINHWPVYAFCMTDDSVHLIVSVSDLPALELEMKIVCRRFLMIHEGFPNQEIRLEMIEKETIGSKEELVRRCRAVHRLPLVLGYVERIADYWWSSYITYLQYFEWTMVDCSAVLECFSQDPETALRKMKRFHAQKETNSNLFLKKA